MINQGRKIIIELVDGEIVQTSYCGSFEMFDMRMPKFIISVDIDADSFTVKINREDLSNFYDYIREHGTSVIKTF